MSDMYDYAISVELLQPPRSVDHHYAAHVTYFIREQGRLVKELDPAECGITEVWGRTKDEARHKLERRLEHWIAREIAATEGAWLREVA